MTNTTTAVVDELRFVIGSANRMAEQLKIVVANASDDLAIETAEKTASGFLAIAERLDRIATALTQAGAEPVANVAAMANALRLFMYAKGWVASDDYDGIDAGGRRALENADEAAKAALAGAPFTQSTSPPHAYLQPVTMNSSPAFHFEKVRDESPEEYADWYPVWTTPPAPSPVAASDGVMAPTEAMIDKFLRARVPGGAEVSAWLPQAKDGTPHETARNVVLSGLNAVFGLPYYASPQPPQSVGKDGDA
jgi:hypothetical protein